MTDNPIQVQLETNNGCDRNLICVNLPENPAIK